MRLFLSFLFLKKKKVTEPQGAGGGVRDTSLAARSTLATIKEGNLGHSEKDDTGTVLVNLFD
jgi:hypothetical protein